jgi:hypothetical protein
MTNNYNNYNDNQHIQSISYSKLAEYDQTRIDLPIRKYVLITNLLREPSPTTELEHQWFETCLEELDREEKEQEQGQTTTKFNHKPDLHLHAFYNFRNGSGFLVCTSNLS